MATGNKAVFSTVQYTYTGSGSMKLKSLSGEACKIGLCHLYDTCHFYLNGIHSFPKLVAQAAHMVNAVSEQASSAVQGNSHIWMMRCYQALQISGLHQLNEYYKPADPCHTDYRRSAQFISATDWQNPNRIQDQWDSTVFVWQLKDPKNLSMHQEKAVL